MRLVYNRDYLFRGVPKAKHGLYYPRILEFAKDVATEKNILSQNIIKKYSIKKMNGTKGIFKFGLNTSDAARCLIRYEEEDQQIFGSDPGIVLLQIASHDEQGEIGRKLEKAFIDYTKFIDFDDAQADDQGIDNTLGREYMRTIYFYPDMEEDDFLKVLLDDESKYIYKPSEKQYHAIESQGPVLLLGCAGSGKTLVEISKSLRNAHSHIDQAYFTFTAPLKQLAQGIYSKYSSSPNIKGRTYFYAINEYAIERLELSLRVYFGFERYKIWIKEQRIKERFSWIKDVGIMNLWIEIRGLLKGFMGNDYFRNLQIQNATQIFNDKQLKELIDRGVIEVDRQFRSTYNIMKSEELSKYIQQYNDLRNKMIHHDFDKPLIDKYTYMHLKDEYSRFDKDQRNKIYEFVDKVYQKYLEENKLYDDNDLARLVILSNLGNIVNPLDFALIDEVQDLTEMQIYMLVDLVKNPQYVFLSGDVSQVINPTFFQKGRIGLLMRNRKKLPWDRDNVLTLNENYRNSVSVVEVSNKIVDIRQEILGTYTEDIIEISKQLENTEGLPVFIESNEEQFLEAIASWQNAVRVAIIVSSDETKASLIKKMNIKREEAYHIFTVQEAKGQEFDKVVIYNILSDHDEMWQSIMKSSKKNASVHFQYYFNLLYVAVTRARKNLYMFESKRDLAIINELIPLFETVNKNLIQVMDPEEQISEDMILKQAQDLFKAEDYERARLNYLRINRRKDASICRGYSLIQSGKFEEGILLLYRFKDHQEFAYRYTNTKDSLFFHLLLGYSLKKLDLDYILKHIHNHSIIDMVSAYKNDRNYIDLFDKAIQLSSAIYRRKIDKKLKGMNL